MQLWLCPFIAFFLGSIPFGWWIARAKGVEIRNHGSGNIGATNVWRVLGKGPGMLCLLLDALKGYLPVALAINLLQLSGRTITFPLPLPEAWMLTLPETQAALGQTIHVLTALAAVMGHNYSPWVGFRGGKGIATSAGVLLALMPPIAMLLLLIIWLLLFFTTRYVSLASIGAAVALPLLTLWGSWHHGRIHDGTWNFPLFGFTVLIALSAIWKHRSNIQRLLHGTENRMIRKR